MAERFITNLDMSNLTYGAAQLKAWFMPEALRVFGYELESSVGAGWTNAAALLINDTGAPGFSVSAAEPFIVTDLDVTGRFTVAMEDGSHFLSLLAANDRNRSMWKIERYIDAHNVIIDPDGFDPKGWVTETTIPGRVFNPDGVALGNENEQLLNAPFPSRLQIRVRHKDFDEVYLYARPMGQDLVLTGYEGEDGYNLDATGLPTMAASIPLGFLNKHMVGATATLSNFDNAGNNGAFTITAVDEEAGTFEYTNASGVSEQMTDNDTITIAGDATETADGENWTYSSELDMIFQAYGLDESWSVHCENEDGNPSFAMGGELTDTPIHDSCPGFVYAKSIAPVVPNWIVKMLDGAVSPGQINGYPSEVVRDDSYDADTAGRSAYPGRRIENGGALLFSPDCIMDNIVTVGACRRGRFPDVFRSINRNFEELRPINSTGKLWAHMRNGYCIPRVDVSALLPKVP